MENEIIRKISIGSDVNNQLHIAVGSRIGGVVVSHIFENMPKMFDVWIHEDLNSVVKWKSISGMPVIVEYNTRID